MSVEFVVVVTAVVGGGEVMNANRHTMLK